MTARKTTRKPPAGRVTPPKPKPAEPRLAVLKVLVQPVLVLIDEKGACQEVQHPVVEVKGADWATWARGAFTPARLEELRQSVAPIAAQ